MAYPFASAGLAAQPAGCLCQCSSGQAAGHSLLLSIGRSLDHPWHIWHNAKQGSLGPLHLPMLAALLEAGLQSECTCLENLEPPAHIAQAVGCSLCSTSQGPLTFTNSHPKTASKGNTSRVSFVMVLSQHPQVSSTYLVTVIPVLKANVFRRRKYQPTSCKEP